ncbi:MAG: type II toxin-antitoxin system HicA family toxin [Chloroflexi bacterium]|nr:type II toxin-antitoxin system HicA family toxin [Chloroflexota bacterium]
MARVLVRLGFRVSRQSGSHRIYFNDQGRRVTLPYHARKILHPKLLTSILRDIGISVDELRELL